MGADFKVWEGVYATFSEAPATGPGFTGAIWRDRSLQAARETMAALDTDAPLDYSLRQRNAVLPVVCAMLLAQKPRIRILDFGGGLGSGHMLVSKAVNDAVGRVDYWVVEMDGICSTGRELFAGWRDVTFTPEFPADTDFDVVYTASALQYVEDWKALVARLASYQAQYLIFADAFVGEFRSFVTLQNYYGSRIPHWFLNRAELENAASGHGYRLALRTGCDARILQNYGPLPMTNFPPELRIAHSSHLLFRLDRVVDER